MESSTLEEVYEVIGQFLPGKVASTLRLTQGTVLEARQSFILDNKFFGINKVVW